MNRREFLGVAALTAPLALAAPLRRLQIGHTGITWGFQPDDAAGAIKDIASLGYRGYESFGDVLQAWEPKGSLKILLDQSKLPLISAYCGVNLTDPARRSAEVDKIVAWAKLIQKCGGSTAVIGPNGVKRPSFDFKTSKPAIVAALNEIGQALAGIGITGALHQHTGTCIEYRDEVYAVMESVDTKVVKFGPDIGQLAKGGSDAVQVVKDFLPVIRHVHIKDWKGGPHWVEYCPLGKGRVNIPAVMDLLETQPELKIVMVELDPSPNPPMTAIETARTSRDYLRKLGYSFGA